MDDKSSKNAAVRKPGNAKKNMPQKSIPTPAFHDLIGAKLKSYYAQITEEPIPDRFTELLKQLDSEAQNDRKRP